MYRISILITLLMVAPAAGAGSCTSNQDGIYKCSHVELVSSLTRAEIGADDSTFHDIANDIWGWTDPDDGKEYVIQGMYNGTAFIDISDPENPRFLGRLLSPPATPPAEKPGMQVTQKCHDGCEVGGGDEGEGTSSWQDIKVYDHYAYIVSEQDWFGLLVFDLHDLRGVTVPQTFTAANHIRDFRNAHNIFINEDTGFAYVIGNTAPDIDRNFGGLLIYDLADPGNPVQVADYEDTGYVHDVACVVYHGPDADYQDHEICFASNSGSRKNTDSASPYYGQTFYYDDNTETYRSDWTYDGTYLNWDGGGSTLWPTPAERYSRLTVLDVTDKSAIENLSDAQHPDSTYIHQSWPSEDHRYLFVNDELEEGAYGSRTRSYTYDLNDLDAIEHVATYTAPNLAIDHNEYVKGRLLFQSNYDSGLRILDASDPLNLVEVGFFDSLPGSDQAVFAGTWSNYPWFESGVIPFSDMDGGVFLVRHYLEDASELGSDIATAAALLDGNGGEHTYFLALANNGPAAADEIDVTVHLPAGLTFNSVDDGTDFTCSGADRSVVCQLASLPSCTATLLSLALDGSTPAEVEIIGMAAARQLDPEGRTSDNLATLTVAGKQAVVDSDALQTGLVGAACDSQPAVDAGEAQRVTAGVVVNLLAAGSDPLAPVVSYAWAQTAGEPVSLTTTSAAATSFTAPALMQAADLEFSVTVTNAYGATASDTVTVKVLPETANPNAGGGALAWLLLPLGLLVMGRRAR